MPSQSLESALQVQQRLPHEEVLRLVGRVADSAEIECYAVGGVIRDAVLGRPVEELDFVALGPGNGIRLARAVAEEFGGPPPAVYANFGTAAVRVPVRFGVGTLEFVGARKESYRRESRKPIVEEGSLEDDQRRRDFTVNAMAVAVNGRRFGDLLDPFDGMSDLAASILRTPLDPVATFDDDPLRMVRAARFAAQLGFRIEERTYDAMKACAGRIQIVSRERVETELQKIIDSPQPSVGFRILFETGLLAFVLPDLADLAGVETVAGYAHKDNFYHSLQVVDNVAHLTADRPAEETRWLRWAALLHDVAKTQTKRFVPRTGWTFHGHEEVGARMIPRLFRKLKLPSDDRMRRVQQLVRLHHRPVALVDEHVTDSAVRRLLYDAGELIDDLMILVRADITSRNPRRVRRYLDQFDLVERKMAEVEEKDRLRSFQPPVDGQEIMDTLGIQEGIAVGIIKEHIREAILDGRIPNEHDPAFALMMEIKDDAIRRGLLFEKLLVALAPKERQALGPLKETILHGPVPEDDDEAMAYLLALKDRVLQGPSDDDAPPMDHPHGS